MQATAKESALERAQHESTTGTPPDATSADDAAEDLARDLVDVLVDRQASDVVLLDLTSLDAFTDYFVIATATNERQLRALIDALGRERKERDLSEWHEEGLTASGWVLIDLGDVVVHLFSEERRAYYDLEGLWRRAQEVVRVQ